MLKTFWLLLVMVKMSVSLAATPNPFHAKANELKAKGLTITSTDLAQQLCQNAVFSKKGHNERCLEVTQNSKSKSLYATALEICTAEWFKEQNSNGLTVANCFANAARLIQNPVLSKKLQISIDFFAYAQATIGYKERTYENIFREFQESSQAVSPLSRNPFRFQ